MKPLNKNHIGKLVPVLVLCNLTRSGKINRRNDQDADFGRDVRAKKGKLLDSEI